MNTKCRIAITLALGIGAAPAALAGVTGAGLVAAPPTFSGPCPTTIKFSGQIAVDKPRTIEYTWVRSDGATAPTASLVFPAAGKQAVSTTWTLGGPALPSFSGWKQIKVLRPNAMLSKQAKFSIKCRPAVVAPVGVPVAGVKPPVLPPAQCPDPAAHELGFSIVSRTSQFAGRVRIVGTARNVGAAPYESGPNQQSLQLYESIPGGTPRMVAQQAFQNLAPGAEVSVRYERDWNSSSPAEGEFPPSYKLMVVYDPDIRLDSNTKNDDCNNANNSKERNGSEINALFR